MAMNEVNKITVAPAVAASDAAAAAAQASEAKEVMNSTFTEAGAQPVKEEVSGEIKMGGDDSPEALAIKAREDAVKAHQEADTAKAKVQRELDENNKLVGGKEYVAQLEKELEAIKQQEKEAKQKKAEIEKDIATKQKNKQRLEASVLEGKSKADAAIIKHGDDIKAKKQEINEAKKHVRELEKEAKQAGKAAKAADKNYQELFNAAKKQIQGEKKEKISDIRSDAKANKTVVKQSEGEVEGENKNVSRDVSRAQYQKKEMEETQKEIDEMKAGLADKEKEPLKGLEEAKQELEKTQNAVGEKERIYTEKQAEFKKLKSLTPEQTQEQMQLLEEYNSALDEQAKAEREVKIKQELYDKEQKKIERKEQELDNLKREWEQAVSTGKTTIKTEKKSDIETARDEAKQRIDILKGNDPKPEKKAEAPKAEAPKAEAPKAEAPKAEAPKAEAPKAEAPKAEAPKAEAPKAEAPKAEAPKVEAPKAEAPKVEAPKAEAPKAEVPKAEAPKAEAPKAEAPKAEAPKVEAPKAEAPKAEAPKAEAPKAEAPKAEAPKAEAPKAEAPKAEVPKAEAPKAEAPQERTQGEKQVTVLNGESFIKLAKKYGVSVEDLIALNKDKIHQYKDCNDKVHKFFRVGETIKLPDGANAEAVNANQSANKNDETRKYSEKLYSEANIKKLAERNCSSEIAAAGDKRLAKAIDDYRKAHNM